MKTHQVVLLIGGNLGDRFLYLSQALGRIRAAFQLIKKSGVYETEAWGGSSSGNYLNQALLVQTDLQPSQVLAIGKEIEESLGRKRDVHWGDRTMDIDIIYFDDTIIHTPLLTIPHPLLHQRRFVLLPLVELIPFFVHPVFQLNQLELLSKLDDESRVVRLPDSSSWQ